MERFITIDNILAEKYGIEAALIYAIIKNELNACIQLQMNKYDGRYWIRKPQADICAQFPYIKPRAVSSALTRLKAAGLLVEARFNEDPFDQTKWYSITDYDERSI